MEIFNLFFAVFALDEIFGHAAIERAGPVERENRDEIFEAIGPDAHGHLADAGAFQLEDARGVAFAERLVGLLVVQALDGRDRLFAAGRLDELQAIVDQGQRFETEEIELDQADLFDPGHFDTG